MIKWSQTLGKTLCHPLPKLGQGTHDAKAAASAWGGPQFQVRGVGQKGGVQNLPEVLAGVKILKDLKNMSKLILNNFDIFWDILTLLL